MLGHAANALEIIERLFIGQSIGILREGGGGWKLRPFNVKQQTKITNRLAFAICNFVGNVDSTTDGYTRWRVGLTNWSDATAHASVCRTPIGLLQF